MKMIEEGALDYIIKDGFKRIDEAIEKVIAKHAWVTPEENLMKKRFRINTDVVYIDPMNKSHVYKRDSPMAELYLERLRLEAGGYNYTRWIEWEN